MTNDIRDTIVTAIEVSKYSKVPMLFIANPGLGKTTIINEYGKRNNMHVESLIGSAFDRSEVLGYQVNNGGDSLKTLRPQWFQSIKDAAAKKQASILFIDELSTAPADVQGSLFRLIFERTIGNGEELPDDCVVLSAANYKDNLPTYFEITAPALNRFCIINLTPKSNDAFIDEFLSTEKERTASWPKFKEYKLTDEFAEKAQKKIKDFFTNLFTAYSNGGDSSKGTLDIDNKNFNEMYSADLAKNKEVLNFISGRTMSYFLRTVTAAAVLGVSAKSSFIERMADGLIGAGTNNFENAKMLTFYRTSIQNQTSKIIKDLESGSDSGTTTKILDGSESSIAERCQKISAYFDGNGFDGIGASAAISELYAEVVKKYGNDFTKSIMDSIGPNVDGAENNYAIMVADMMALKGLVKIIPNMGVFSQDASRVVEQLNDIIRQYNFYCTMSI